MLNIYETVLAECILQLYKKGVLNMSAKKEQNRRFRSNQRLFLLGVTTFGAMLTFVTVPSFAQTVHASDISDSISTPKDTPNNESINPEDNSLNDNYDNESQVTKDVLNNHVNNVDTGNSTNTNKISAYYSTRTDSSTTQNVASKTTAQSAVNNQTTARTVADATPSTASISKNATKINTTIGNSVEDTPTYQSIQKTATTMNQSSVNIDQAYFGLAGDAIVDQQLKEMGAETAANLNNNGYIIKSGIVNNKQTLVVQGKDTTGLYYAINNLNNLIAQKNDLSKVNIKESPQMSIRGVIEGFYGQPWSQQARKDLFQFMGAHKMNVYIYSPKDDDYLRNNWKELYPQDKLDQIKDLVVAAKKNHVQFVYTLSPGNDITYSSQEDFDKTTAKLDQLRSIGVTQFYIALDDIPVTMTKADAAVFKNHPTTNYPNNPWSALADAQAFYLNRVQREYVEKNNLPALWLVPTNYAGSKQDPFKEAQGEALDKNIRIQWTGEGVFSGDITDASVEQAKKTYHSDHIFIWDNFPVNDSDQDRLYLNPLEGRSKSLYKIMDGFTSNPMIQPYASWFGLAGYGDYMWNADTYSPIVTQNSTIHELAGDDENVQATLQSFVDLNQYWDYATDANKVHAPILSIYLNAYDEAVYGTSEYTTAKNNLIERLNIIANAPEVLQNMKTVGFYNDSLPWINAASHWAKATIASIDLLDKIDSGQASPDNLSADFATMNTQINLAKAKALPDSRTGLPDLVITPSVGDGVFQTFNEKTNTAINQWLGSFVLQTGAVQVASDATTDVPHNGNNVAANMNDNDLTTQYWSNRSVKKGDTITVDLKEAQDIQRINIHQGSSDDVTTGDILRSAVIYAGNNSDGSDKEAIGQVTATGNVQVELNQPIKARYLFIVSTSNTDNWLQIRNISVFGKTGLNIENIESIDNTSSQSMFDGTVKTAFIGKLKDNQKTAMIEQSFIPLTGMKSVYLTGKVSGTIYAHIDGTWQKLGRAESNQSITKLALKQGTVDGIKLVIDSNTPDFNINEFSLSTN